MAIPMEKIRDYLKHLRVIYSDVDGTFMHAGCLFRNARGYSFKNARAIYHLLTAGVDVVMTSGREKEKLKETARILGFKNYIANLGIEIVYHQGEKVITHLGVDVPDQQSLKAWILGSGVLEKIMARFPGKVRPYQPWFDILRTHLLLVGELNYPEAVHWMETHYPALRIIDNGAVPPEPDFNVPHAYHILPRNVGKKAAVAIDKKERQLKTDSLIAIGDSLEDVSIAEEVAVFFLLDPAVKTDRDNVIRVPNDDGEGFSRIVAALKKAHYF